MLGSWRLVCLRLGYDAGRNSQSSPLVYRCYATDGQSSAARLGIIEPTSLTSPDPCLLSAWSDSDYVASMYRCMWFEGRCDLSRSP